VRQTRPSSTSRTYLRLADELAFQGELRLLPAPQTTELVLLVDQFFIPCLQLVCLLLDVLLEVRLLFLQLVVGICEVSGQQNHRMQAYL
jgi:hypothetical protein